MPSLILPSRYNQQPQQAAPLDLGSPITKGVRLVVSGAAPGRAAFGPKITQVGTAASVAGLAGRYQTFNGSDQGLSVPLDLTNTKAVTVVAIVDRFAGTGNQQNLWEFGTDVIGTSQGFDAYINGGGETEVWLGANGGRQGNVYASASSAQHALVAVYDNAKPDGTQISFSVDGVLQTRTGQPLSGGTNAAFLSDTLYIGSRTSSGSWANGRIALFILFDRALSQNEVQQISANPWQIFKAPPRRLWAASGAPSAITGTFAATEGSDTATATGTVTFPAVTGTLNRAEGSDTLAASGTVAYPPVSGTLAATESPDALAAAGTVGYSAISGTLAAVEGPDTAAASGTVAYPGISGTLTATEGADMAAATGSAAYPAITGALASTEVADTFAALGTVGNAIFGSMGATEAPDTASATGTITNPPISGVMASTEAADTLAASGAVTFPAIAGTLAVSEAADALSAAGSVLSPITGTLAAAEQPDTLAASDQAPAPPVSDGSGAGNWGEVRKYADLLDRADKPTKAQKKRRRQVIEAAVLELLPDEPEAEKAAPIIAKLVAQDQAKAMATWAPARVLQPVSRKPVAMPAAVEIDMRARVQEWLEHQAFLAELEDEFETELLLLE